MHTRRIVNVGSHFTSVTNNELVDVTTIRYSLFLPIFCNTSVYIFTLVMDAWPLEGDGEDLFSLPNHYSFCIFVLFHPFSRIPFPIRFICSTHRHSSSCILTTVRTVSSSVIGIGFSLFIHYSYITSKERTPTYCTYSPELDLLVTAILTNFVYFKL